MKKKLDKNQLSIVRYSEDRSSKASLPTHSDILTQLKNSFLMNHLPVNKKLTPKIYQSVEDCLFTLGIDSMIHNVSIFIYQDHEVNAKCLTGFKNNIIILLSSSLVKFFKLDELKFVIGHELGHYLFHQNSVKQSSNRNLESFILRRAKEITADRVGLLCCQSLDTSIKAMLKMLSGLDENHLVFNIASILEELKNVDPSNIPIEEMCASHPPLAIRSRALLWFSMGKVYLDLIGKVSTGCLCEKTIDSRVKNDLTKYLDSQCLNQIQKTKNDFKFWILSLIFLKDRTFSKEEQSIISKIFGQEKMEKLKNFICSSSKEQVMKSITHNCVQSFFSYFTEAPKESISYLRNLDNTIKEEFGISNSLPFVLDKCPDLNKYL